VLALLVASLLGLAGGPDAAAATTTPTGLTWAPPAGYEGFTSRQIPSSGGTVLLDDQTDYLLRAPTTITGPVTIRGGRHVVWIGGHVDIDACCVGEATNRRAVMIVDGANPMRGRIVHLEGLHLEGDYLAEGIDINADLAIVQIQNVRVDNLRLRAGGHPDVIQPWGSFGELRVDRLTGRTDYQGLFLRVDLANHPPGGPVYLRRVNLEAFQSAESVGHTLYSMWNDSTDPVHVDQVYSQPHPNSAYGPEAAQATILVQDGVRVDPVSNGGVLSWPNYPTRVRTWDGLAIGSVVAGTPVNGDFVPASAVGLSYVSPGYGDPAPAPTPAPTPPRCRHGSRKPCRLSQASPGWRGVVEERALLTWR
jgi:hypothetical protein